MRFPNLVAKNRKVLPIKTHLFILTTICVLGGIGLSLSILVQYRSIDQEQFAVGTNSLFVRDLESLRNIIDDVLVVADLVIGAGETYLADGANKNIIRLRNQINQMRASRLGATFESEFSELHDSAKTLGRQLKISAADPPSSNEELLAEFDEESTILVDHFIRLQEHALTISTEAEKRLLSKRRVVTARAFWSSLGYLILVSATFIWVLLRVARPLQTLTVSAERAMKEGASFKAEGNGSQETILLGQTIALFVSTLEEKVLLRSADLQRKTEALKREVERRIEIEKETRLAAEKAEAASRSKSLFLANVSHEIRTPMTAILGYAELIDPSHLDPDEQNAVLIIRQSGQHLLSIINDILDIARIEANKLEVLNKRCSLTSIIAEVASSMSVLAADKGLDFLVDFQTLIPESIESDPVRLRQILVNLIGNSIKFTNKGFVRVSVRAEESKEKESWVRIKVTDSGIGIASEEISQIFEAFSQADSSGTRVYGGTGLGLTISMRLIQMLGGSIECESEAGKGSKFTIQLPTGSTEGIPMIEGYVWARSAPEIEEPTDLVNLNGKRILVAEDNVINSRYVRKILETAGLQVEVAENGKIAFSKALKEASSSGGYDLILMDMQMPKMDGYEVTSKLRQQGYTAPIIALTAHAMTSDREKCLRSGCDEYTSKPIKKAALLKLIQSHIKNTDRTKTFANAESLPRINEGGELSNS